MSLERFDELQERYADGILTPPERAEFLTLLETAAGRARFAETASYEAALSEELRVATAVDRKGSSRSLQRVGSRRIPIVASPEPDESRTLGWIAALAAAAVLVILTLVFATSFRSKAPQPTAMHLPAPQKVDSREADAPRRENPPVAPLAAPRLVTHEPAFVPAPLTPKTETPTPVRVEIVKPVTPTAPSPAISGT